MSSFETLAATLAQQTVEPTVPGMHYEACQVDGWTDAVIKGPLRDGDQAKISGRYVWNSNSTAIVELDLFLNTSLIKDPV